ADHVRADRAAALSRHAVVVPRRGDPARGAVLADRRLLVPVGARLPPEPGGLGRDHRAARRRRGDGAGDAALPRHGVRTRARRLRTGDDLRHGLHAGAVKRIRPKTMTVMTAMLGLLPLLWASGTGADVTRRLVAPLIGGIAVSFCMELLVYPVIFYLWKRVQ